MTLDNLREGVAVFGADGRLKLANREFTRLWNLSPDTLAAGAHVADDLEGVRRELSQSFPEVQFELCPPLGIHPLMVEIVLDRLSQGSSGATC